MRSGWLPTGAGWVLLITKTSAPMPPLMVLERPPRLVMVSGEELSSSKPLPPASMLRPPAGLSTSTRSLVLRLRPRPAGSCSRIEPLERESRTAWVLPSSKPEASSLIRRPGLNTAEEGWVAASLLS